MPNGGSNLPNSSVMEHRPGHPDTTHLVTSLDLSLSLIGSCTRLDHLSTEKGKSIVANSLGVGLEIACSRSVLSIRGIVPMIDSLA